MKGSGLKQKCIWSSNVESDYSEFSPLDFGLECVAQRLLKDIADTHFYVIMGTQHIPVGLQKKLILQYIWAVSQKVARFGFKKKIDSAMHSG